MRSVLYLFLLALITSSCYQNEDIYDLVIYGSTPAGITAAIQAKRMGHFTILISPNNHLGGATTGGLTSTDYGREETIGGLADEFYARIKKHYDDPASWKYENRDSSEVYNRFGAEGRYIMCFEPSVALNIFYEMLNENGVQIIMNHPINSVDKEGTDLHSITSVSGKTFKGKMFIDATYEGDLMALAGVSYHVGRESEAQYGEDLAGVLGEVENYRQPKKYFGKEVNPYDDDGNPLPGIQDVEMGEPGSADSKIQAYNFRMCLSRHPDNRIPITKPEDYDPWTYELLARFIAANPPAKLTNLLSIRPVPNLKTDINDGGYSLPFSPFSTDYIGANWDYPEGDAATRASIIADHVRFTKGLIYFIGHDDRVPENVRNEMLQYGYPKDEFVTTNNWNPQLYIRETRRMIGEYVMTQHDCQKDTIKATSIGMGSYGVDSHHLQRVIKDGEVMNEGNFTAHHHPYEIPYESLLPKREECGNLLVPVCLSSSHIAFGSIRMEPVYMILGQSSATAAMLALEEDILLHDLDYEQLAKLLVDDGLKLKFDGL